MRALAVVVCLLAGCQDRGAPSAPAQRPEDVCKALVAKVVPVLKAEVTRTGGQMAPDMEAQAMEKCLAQGSKISQDSQARCVLAAADDAAIKQCLGLP